MRVALLGGIAVLVLGCGSSTTPTMQMLEVASDVRAKPDHRTVVEDSLPTSEVPASDKDGIPTADVSEIGFTGIVDTSADVEGDADTGLPEDNTNPEEDTEEEVEEDVEDGYDLNSVVPEGAQLVAHLTWECEDPEDPCELDLHLNNGNVFAVDAEYYLITDCFWANPNPDWPESCDIDPKVPCLTDPMWIEHEEVTAETIYMEEPSTNYVFAVHHWNYKNVVQAPIDATLTIYFEFDGIGQQFPPFVYDGVFKRQLYDGDLWYFSITDGVVVGEKLFANYP